MKQHITIEQMLELKPSKLEKIINVNPVTLDRIIEQKDVPYWRNSLNDLAWGVSIGKMIELLKKNNQEIRINIDTKKEQAFSVFVRSHELNEDYETEYKGSELCDILWLIVKSVFAGRVVLD